MQKEKWFDAPSAYRGYPRRSKTFAARWELSHSRGKWPQDEQEWPGCYTTAYFVAGLVFFSTCFIASRYSRWLERRLRAARRCEPSSLRSSISASPLVAVIGMTDYLSAVREAASHAVGARIASCASSRGRGVMPVALRASANSFYLSGLAAASGLPHYRGAPDSRRNALVRSGFGLHIFRASQPRKLSSTSRKRNRRRDASCAKTARRQVRRLARRPPPFVERRSARRRVAGPHKAYANERHNPQAPPPPSEPPAKKARTAGYRRLTKTLPRVNVRRQGAAVTRKGFLSSY